MPKTIADIPYELLSQILEEACFPNKRGCGGLVISSVKRQRFFNKTAGPDRKTWAATNSIRRVNHLWHQWALKVALQELYISEWQGIGE